MAVVNSLSGYHTFSYQPKLPERMRKNLNKIAAFDIAEIATRVFCSRFQSCRLSVITLHDLFLVQGIRTSVKHDLLLEPMAVSVPPIGFYRPEVAVAYIPRSFKKEDLFKEMNKVDLTSYL
ncbi:MAG: hypothetical protein AABX86_02620 [Nanoarchaeota archaeon]